MCDKLTPMDLTALPSTHNSGLGVYGKYKHHYHALKVPDRRKVNLPQLFKIGQKYYKSYKGDDFERRYSFGVGIHLTVPYKCRLTFTNTDDALLFGSPRQSETTYYIEQIFIPIQTYRQVNRLRKGVSYLLEAADKETIAGEL